MNRIQREEESIGGHVAHGLSHCIASRRIANILPAEKSQSPAVLTIAGQVNGSKQYINLLDGSMRVLEQVGYTTAIS